MDIATFFYKSLKNLEITNKTQGITVENASVNTTFLAELETKFLLDDISFSSEDQHFRCFAHIINLAVQEVLVKLRLDNVAEDDEDDDDEDDHNNH